MSFCRLDLNCKELKTYALNGRTQKSSNLCQGNIKGPNKWACQASSFGERATQLKNRFLVLFLNNTEIVFSAPSNKEKHYYYLHCAFSVDSKRSAAAAEHPSATLQSGGDLGLIQSTPRQLCVGRAGGGSAV